MNSMPKETSFTDSQSKDIGNNAFPESLDSPVLRNKKTTERESQAASPADESVGGEEDPGVALEFTVNKAPKSR